MVSELVAESIIGQFSIIFLDNTIAPFNVIHRSNCRTVRHRLDGLADYFENRRCLSTVASEERSSMNRIMMFATIALTPASLIYLVAEDASPIHSSHEVIEVSRFSQMDHEWAWPKHASVVKADNYTIRTGEVVAFESDTVIWATESIRIDGTIATTDGSNGADAPDLWLVTGPSGRVEINGTVYVGNGGHSVQVGFAGGDGANLTILSPTILVAEAIESLYAGDGGEGGLGALGGNGGSVRVAGDIGRPQTGRGQEFKDGLELWVRAGHGGLGGDSAMSMKTPEFNRPGNGGHGGDALGSSWLSVAEWLGYPEQPRGFGQGAGGIAGAPGGPCQAGGSGGPGTNFVGGNGANGTNGNDSVVIYDKEGNITFSLAPGDGSTAGNGGSGSGGSGGLGGAGGLCCPFGSGPGGNGGKGGKGGGAYAGYGGRGGNGGTTLHPQVFPIGGSGGNGGNGGNAAGGNGGHGGAGGSSDNAPGTGGPGGSGGSATFGSGGDGGIGQQGGLPGWDGIDGFAVGGDGGDVGSNCGPCPFVKEK